MASVKTLPEDFESRLAKMKQDLKTKKSFVSACQSLVELCDCCQEDSIPKAAAEQLAEVGKTAFTILQTRFSSPKFWQAGLDLFLSIEFNLPTLVPSATSWREIAIEEVDDDARERAREQGKLRRLQEDRMHNKGMFGDAVTPISMAELLAVNGLVAVDPEEERRPAMSRDARAELRLVTVLEEDNCAVCQESMPLGSKAKAMPCKHIFHDECLESWVQKHNSCPTCRFDELPSEKQHFDDVQRQVQQAAPGRSGVYS